MDGDAVTTLWSVLVGGGLTVVGGAAVELLRGRSQSKSRAVDVAVAERRYTRDLLDRVTEAAVAYQLALRAYARAIRAHGPVPAEVQLDFARTRARFQSLVYRLPGAQSGALLAWEEAALDWAQTDGPAQVEAARWNTAMALCGDESRRELD